MSEQMLKKFLDNDLSFNKVGVLLTVQESFPLLPILSEFLWVPYHSSNTKSSTVLNRLNVEEVIRRGK